MGEDVLLSTGRPNMFMVQSTNNYGWGKESVNARSSIGQVAEVERAEEMVTLDMEHMHLSR